MLDSGEGIGDGLHSLTHPQGAAFPAPRPGHRRSATHCLCPTPVPGSAQRLRLAVSRNSPCQCARTALTNRRLRSFSETPSSANASNAGVRSRKETSSGRVALLHPAGGLSSPRLAAANQAANWRTKVLLPLPGAPRSTSQRWRVAAPARSTAGPHRPRPNASMTDRDLGSATAGVISVNRHSRLGVQHDVDFVQGDFLACILIPAHRGQRQHVAPLAQAAQVRRHACFFASRCFRIGQVLQIFDVDTSVDGTAVLHRPPRRYLPPFERQIHLARWKQPRPVR